MRLIDADKLVEKNPELAELVNKAPTVDAVVLPFKPGGDLWYVDTDLGSIGCERNGIQGVIVYLDHFGFIESDGNPGRIGGTYACLSEEEAQKALAEFQKAQQ